ncbi:MAG TPA: V-type ATP synthase subunit A [Thermoanaerobaculia bacterium]|nr:V-type ATP synthase subunit A [Thermoanaerobaculia bacterium]
MTASGRITEISGWTVRARIDQPLSMREVVLVGEQRLIGEIVALDHRDATIQVYEETEGVAPGDPLETTGEPLSIELGPGLLGGIFDGVQRPLTALASAQGDFIARGSRLPALDRDKLWDFEPRIAAGADVAGGTVLGSVAETPALAHPILVPPGVGGRVLSIVGAGPRRVSDPIAEIDTGKEVKILTMCQRWRARAARPAAERLAPDVPLLTGQRVLDTFFPLARGGAAAMPGGFGTGKTVTQHQLCRWADADVIVFVGCGERGNEIAELVRELPQLVDPRTKRLLAERSVLIANTSNMPVSAREASLFTGITIGEYYRDLGYNVLLLADSISRWAEALREISGRLGEMPAEEGYPPYLSSALASFYERAGYVKTLSGADGSLTVITAISPPAGDLTEPVTRHAQRFVRTFWTLDRQLAAARVFPAISTRASYSDTRPSTPEWSALQSEAMAFLEESARIDETARLVGIESLPEREQFLLHLADAFQEGFLQQNAYDEVDAYCAPQRQIELLEEFMRARREGLKTIESGAPPAVDFNALIKMKNELSVVGSQLPGNTADNRQLTTDNAAQSAAMKP